jgi:hypothetical protein
MYKLNHIETDVITRQLKGQWQVGDWCVNGYEIKVIKEIKGDKVTGLSTGYIESHYNNFNPDLFPLTMQTKRIVEGVESEYKKLRQYNNLNFPDINRKYESFAWDGCKLTFKDFEEEEVCLKAFEKFWREVYDFTNSILDGVESLKGKEVKGVRLFR